MILVLDDGSPFLFDEVAGEWSPIAPEVLAETHRLGADTVMAATSWRNNAEMIADAFRLGYLRKDWRTIDPTFGRGLWWTLERPDDLVAHDLYTLDGVDFTKLPEPDHSFDAAVFDPPYVSMGGRATSTLPDFADRFGLMRAPSTPAGLQALIDDGLDELRRVLKTRGIVLVKCQNYVSSGHLWTGAKRTLDRAEAIGFEVVDWWTHVGHVRAQPTGRRIVHARQNASTLFVLRSPK